MYEIIPSPGTNNTSFADIEAKIKQLAPFSKTIHIDVVDGEYASTKTHLDPKPFEVYTKGPLAHEGLKFEVHLMVKNPITYLRSFADAGFYRFIGHIEHMTNQEEFVAQAQLLGEVGLAIDKQTSIDDIRVPLDDLDMLLIMTIQAGASGQKFEEELLEKVKAIRSKSETLPVEVDGGINDETIEAAAAAGANRFVATSFLFNLQTPQEQFTLLHHKLQSFEGPPQ